MMYVCSQDTFCTDLVRILRYNIQQDTDNEVLKKTNQACRSIFINVRTTRGCFTQVFYILSLVCGRLLDPSMCRVYMYNV